MKILASAPVFAILYILFMLPTYFLPYLGSNSAGMIAIQQSAMSASQGGTLFFTFVHLACLAVLVLITFVRAQFVGKMWLVVFPFLAAVFDFVPGLSIIPLVPTVMHLLAIVIGVSSSSSATVSTPLENLSESQRLAELKNLNGQSNVVSIAVAMFVVGIFFLIWQFM